MNRNPFKRFLILLGFLLLIILVHVAYWRWKDNWHAFLADDIRQEKGYTLASERLFTESDVPFLDRISRERIKVVDRTKESVVGIKAVGRILVKTYYPGGRKTRVEIRQKFNYGSGTIVTKEGHVVTNNHVVDGFSEFHMLFADNHKCFARKRGTDYKYDLAVLKLYTSKKIKPLPFGNSDHVKMGQSVLSFGNAYGMGVSVNRGLVSADLKQFGKGEWRIQIDGSIHPGHSGGPLINIFGEMVGLNTSRFGGNKEFTLNEELSNMGFAIPSNIALNIFLELGKTSEWVLNDLGVEFIRFEDTYLEHYKSYLKAPGDRNIIIRRVDPNTPAERAGLRKGDVILKINGKEVYTKHDLFQRLEELPEKGSIDLVVWRGWRGGVAREKNGISLELERPEPYHGRQVSGCVYKIDVIGGELSWVPLEEEAKTKIPGLRVGTIRALSPVAGRLKKGDIIVGINGVELLDEDSIAKFHETDLESLNIEYYRNGEKKTVVVFIGGRGVTPDNTDL